MTKITSVYCGITSCLENSTFNITGCTETGTSIYLLCVLRLGRITVPSQKFGPYQIPQLASVAPSHLPKLRTFCVAARKKQVSFYYLLQSGVPVPIGVTISHNAEFSTRWSLREVSEWCLGKNAAQQGFFILAKSPG